MPGYHPAKDILKKQNKESSKEKEEILVENKRKEFGTCDLLSALSMVHSLLISSM
jgi:hypothetical protein